MSEGKKTPKNKPTSKKYSKYTIEGDKIIRKEKTCPRCGPGVFLMKASNRSYCGRCHYTEFISSEKKVEAPKESVSSEASTEEKKE
jgi:ubiquitin-small subunit ribosomal protein S27Ae